MTLFEAIRQLKEGQAIEILGKELDYYYGHCGERVVAYRAVEWRHGEPKMTVLQNGVDLNVDVRIVDLPKPKMGLEEGLARLLRNELVQVTTTDNGVPLFALLHGKDSNACSLEYLRSLPIDWQAEADRKEGK